MKILLVDKGLNTIIVDSTELYVKMGENDYTELDDILNTGFNYNLTGNEDMQEFLEQLDLFLKDNNK